MAFDPTTAKEVGFDPATAKAEEPPKQAGRPAEAALAGVNRGVAGLAGLPVDTAQNLLNLVLAGYGAMRTAAGNPDAAPNLVQGSFGGSEYLAGLLNKAGIGTQNPTPDDPASRMAYTGGSIVGSSVVPGAKLGPTVASAVSGATAGEVLGPQWAAPASMVPGAVSTVRGQPKVNQQQNEAVKDARDAGYVLPPSQSNPTMWNRMLEGFAGKLTTAQQASSKNQDTTNLLARRALGLKDDAPLNEDVLKGLRASAGEAYAAIKDYGGGKVKFKPDARFKSEIDSIGGDFAQAAKEFPGLLNNKAIDFLKSELTGKPISPAAAVELTKKLRQDASTNLKAFDDSEKLALGLAQRRAADSIEGLIERNLRGTDLVSNFREARQTIARTYDVEAALNDSTGNVSAAVIARLSNKGKPLGSDLQSVGDFGNAFPKAAQMPEKMGSLPGLSPLDYATGLIAGSASMNPWLGAAAFARPGVRSAILSEPYQRLFSTPSGPVSPESALPAWVRAGVMSNQR